MSKTVNRSIIVFLIPLVLISSTIPAYATEVNSKVENVTTSLRKGQSAPFNGVLLTLHLGAEIKENCSAVVIEQRCNAKITKSTDLCKSDCAKKTEILGGQFTVSKIKYDEIIVAKDKEIQVLHTTIDDLTPSWYQSPRLWLVVGIVAGAAIGAGATVMVVKAVN